MIDYQGMGAKIKQARLSRGVTQEQLAEAAGVGVTHISHLETGSGTVSLKVFLAIINYLECSADEILCNEIKVDRPLVNSWLSELVEDCDETEVKIIADTVTALRQSLRRNHRAE